MTSLTSNTHCLNCQTPLTGNFCSHCGQENRPVKLSIWQLLALFFGGLVNYDGRLLRSIRLLFTKPAALSIAYIEGKRMQYVNPVRFYLFTSAIYFLLANYLVNPELIKIDEKTDGAEVTTEIKEGILEGIRTGIAANENKTTGKAIETDFDTFDDYLANQQTLAAKDRSTDFELKFVEKFYQIKASYSDDTSFVTAFGKEIYKRFPQMLLITLPLLALVSKLVFFRKRHYWYIDHLIYTLHLTTSLFLLLIIQSFLELGAKTFSQNWLEVISSLLGLAWFVYYLISFKRFFEKRWLKTLLFFFWTGLLQTIAFIFVFALLLVVSFFNL